MSIACSVAGGDLVSLAPACTSRVVYLAGEDPPPALIRRVHAIGQHLNQQAREAIAAHLILRPIMGERLNVMEDAQLRDLIKDSTGARLIVLDTLSRIHSLDENSNGDMANLVAVLEHVAASTGASVLYLHHVSKGSAREGQTDQQQAARDASALIDNARWCGFVAKMTEDEAKRLSDAVAAEGDGLLPAIIAIKSFNISYMMRFYAMPIPESGHGIEHSNGIVSAPYHSSCH